MASPTPAPPPHGREPHLVNLKVLRASRPTLAPSSISYYEGSNHASSELQRLDSADPSTAGYGLGGLLKLPSTFGTVYLGETFSALLCLSNDLPPSSDPGHTASAPVLKVEMHTAGPDGVIGSQGGMKHHMQTIRAVDDSLEPGQSTEALVSHEIKELTMHALVCTITYAVQVTTEDGPPRTLSRSFRKVYKFQVSNPLSVRTKAHSPNPSVATSTLSVTERVKVFLEVQVQNQCEHALAFKRMQFLPVNGWAVEDVNSGLFEGASTLLPPAAIRQYVFVLSASSSVAPAAPGSSQGLGRLDIAWRTSYGETGKLQTSMLGRRVPIVPPSLGLPANARTVAPLDQPLPAVYSPIHTQTPLPPTVSNPNPLARPSSRGPSPVSFEQPVPSAHISTPDVSGLEFDLLVTSLSPAHIVRQEPFSIHLRLGVKNTTLSRRRVRVAAQYVQWVPATSLPAVNTDVKPGFGDAASSKQSVDAIAPLSSVPSSSPPPPLPSHPPLSPTESVLLPLPIYTPQPSQPIRGPVPSLEIRLVGTGVVQLGQVDLAPVSIERAPPALAVAEVSVAAAAPEFQQTSEPPSKVQGKQRQHNDDHDGQDLDFSFKFVSTEVGLFSVGGLRILVLDNETDSDDGDRDGGERARGSEEVAPHGQNREREGERERERHAAVVMDLNTIAEVWVSSSSSSSSSTSSSNGV